MSFKIPFRYNDLKLLTSLFIPEQSVRYFIRKILNRKSINSKIFVIKVLRCICSVVIVIAIYTILFKIFSSNDLFKLNLRI